MINDIEQREKVEGILLSLRARCDYSDFDIDYDDVANFGETMDHLFSLESVPLEYLPALEKLLNRLEEYEGQISEAEEALDDTRINVTANAYDAIRQLRSTIFNRSSIPGAETIGRENGQ